MCDKTEFELCRLCLNSRGLLMNVFGENSKLQIMLEKTIEDLIDVKVVEDANYPWLVCSTCMEKLTEFRLFKRRCAECLAVFYDRIQKRCKPATKGWITDREELPSGIKKECCDDPNASDAVDRTAVDVRDDMTVVKEEVDTASECSESPGRDIDSSMVASMQEGCSHWSDSEETGNMDRLQGKESIMSIYNADVKIKEENDTDVLEDEGDLGPGKVSRGQDGVQGQGGAWNHPRKCEIPNEVFAQRDSLKTHLTDAQFAKEGQLICDLSSETFECTSDLNGLLESVHNVIKEHQCSGQFQTFSELRNQISTHTFGSLYKCPKCSKCFKQREHLEGHVSTHRVEKRHKCEVCLKVFAKRRDVNKHMSVHNGQRPFKCAICPKGFAQRGDLNRHALTHTRERPQKCRICLKGFRNKQHLEGHLLTHTGNRPYKCELCSKSFTHTSNLTRHKKLHTSSN